MAYKRRIEVPDGYYHVGTRGNNKRPIFVDDSDRRLFLVMLDRVARRYGWRVFAYCLMGNHYHLVIQISDRGLSRGMCDLNGGYALAFNTRHKRSNHLFGKRFWSALIETQRHLLESCRYVLLNPKRARIVRRLEDYEWSSFRPCLGLALPPACLAVRLFRKLFARDVAAAIDRIRRFVLDGRVPWQPP